MNDQYKYIEKPLTPDIDQELSTEQTDRKQEIIRLRNKAGIRITTLNGFMEWVRQFDSGSYLFRGVPNAAYRIEASTFRRPKEADRDFEKFLQINRVLISDARLHGYDEKDGRKLKDLEILAEFQHFEAATCLIDFTYNALVALWFACLPDSKTSQDSSKPPNGKVYAVQNQPPRFREITSALLEKKIDYFFQNSGDERSQFPQPQSKQLYQWQPRQQNRRIIAQQSIFLFGDSHFDEDAECVIVESSKQDILTALQQVFGITESMLFPDFDGFARLHSESRIYTELSASEYKQRAILEFQRGEHDLAIAYYDEAIRLNPGDAHTYYHRGLVYDSEKQYELAIADYDEAIARKSEDYIEFYQARGRANFSLKRYAPAISDYSEVIRLFPKDTNSFYYRGLAKYELEQYEEAIADYDEAIRRFPRHIEFYRWRGFAKYKLEQYEEAIADYDEAIRIYSHDRKSYYKRGLAKYELKQYATAISDYDKALSLSNPLNMDPDDAYIYYQRALSKKESGRFEEAIADLQTALPLSFRVDDSQLAVIIDHLLQEMRNNRGNPEDE